MAQKRQKRTSTDSGYELLLRWYDILYMTGKADAMNALNVWKFTLGLCAVLVPWPSVAAEFICSNLTQTRYDPSSSEPSYKSFSEISRLHLDINKEQPGNSTMRWSGTQEMEGISSNWPADTKIIESNGVIAASYSVAFDGVASVGTVTVEAGGVLRITENTILAEGVVFDVIEAICERSAR